MVKHYCDIPVNYASFENQSSAESIRTGFFGIQPTSISMDKYIEYAGGRHIVEIYSLMKRRRRRFRGNVRAFSAIFLRPDAVRTEEAAHQTTVHIKERL